MFAESEHRMNEVANNRVFIVDGFPPLFWLMSIFDLDLQFAPQVVVTFERHVKNDSGIRFF